MFQKSRSHLKIPSPRLVTWNKFQNEDLQTVGATLENLLATATLRMGFVHP
jgi:hypothetical protein